MNITERLAKFQMLASRVIEINISNSFYSIDDSNIVSRALDVTHELGNIHQDGDKMFGTVTLTVTVDLEGNPIADGAEPQKYSLCIKIEGGFNGEPAISEEDFTTALEANGCAALYSIARGIIMSISAQTAFSGSIVLPMLSFAIV